MEPSVIAKRSAGNFAIFAACAFILWVWAALINKIAEFLHLSTADHLTRVSTAIAQSSTLEAIVSIWLLTAAVAIAVPSLWRPLSTTTTLMFDIGYGVLGALTGFGLAIGFFEGTWNVFVWALVYSVVIAGGYVLVRRFLPLSEMKSYGNGRLALAAILFLASPLILLWG